MVPESELCKKADFLFQSTYNSLKYYYYKFFQIMFKNVIFH